MNPKSLASEIWEYAKRKHGDDANLRFYRTSWAYTEYVLDMFLT